MIVVSAPGPATIGIAIGTTPIRSLFCASLASAAVWCIALVLECSIASPSSRTIRPPAASNAQIVMPKALSSNSPVQVITRKMTSTANAQVMAVRLRSAAVLSAVRLANMARFPIGFVIAIIEMANFASSAFVIGRS